MTNPANHCVGLLGWLLGHKFHNLVGATWYDTEHCMRCGMPLGGWS